MLVKSNLDKLAPVIGKLALESAFTIADLKAQLAAVGGGMETMSTSNIIKVLLSQRYIQRIEDKPRRYYPTQRGWDWIEAK